MTKHRTTPPYLCAWSYQRQQLGQAASTLAEALQRVIAVYSSHPTAPLSLASRSPVHAADRFSELEEQRAAVRIPAMRQSIFLVPTELAPRIFAATRVPIEKQKRRLEYAGLSLDEYAQLKRHVLKHTQQPIAANDLQKALAADESAKAGTRIMTGVRLMSAEGLVLRLGTSLRTDSLRYVATEAWLGHPFEEVDSEEALAWLAGEYLRAYGPVRIKDFAWWSGASRRSAAAAIKAANPVEIGDELLLLAEDQPAFESVDPETLDSKALDLLPKWDASTMGYAPDGRQRFVDDRHLTKAYSTSESASGATIGDGLPLILRGGRAVASWSHRFKGNRMRVEILSFEAKALPSDQLQSSFDRIGQMLGATSVEIAVDPPSRS